MIAGFEEVSDGAIRVGARPVHPLAPSQRDVAIAFEGYALYPPLKVRQNLGFALLRGRQPRERLDAREIGRGSCRERACQYEGHMVVDQSLKKKQNNSNKP